MNRRSFLADWRDAVRDSELKPNPKLVAFALSTYMNRDGACWPAKDTLAAATSLSKRAVDSAIGKLVLFGFLLVTRSRGRTSNRYQAAIPTVQDVQGSDTPNRAADDTQPCSKRPPTLHRVHPKAVESRKKAPENFLNRPWIVEQCSDCGRHEPVIDTGIRLLCEPCLSEAGLPIPPGHPDREELNF
jgi:hypothetical protein